MGCGKRRRGLRKENDEKVFGFGGLIGHEIMKNCRRSSTATKFYLLCLVSREESSRLFN